MPVSILDDPKIIEIYDPEKILDDFLELPLQIKKTLEILEDWGLEPFIPKNILISGMGGSAIGGEILKEFLKYKLNLPIIVNREYELTEFINEESLIFSISYSGNTEETLQTYEEAKGKGAKIIAFSVGGLLREKACHDLTPHFSLPSGHQPRAALGSIFFALLSALIKLKIIPQQTQEIEEMLENLYFFQRDFRFKIPILKNYAKKLAIKLYKKIPVIYGSWSYFGAAAMRWRNQFNENAKIIALSNIFPELNHNEIAAWDNPETSYENFFVIILRDKDDPVRIQKRINLTKQIIQKKAEVEEIWAKGDGELSKIFSLIFLGDIASVYLAILQKINPAQIEIINFLKKELVKENE
ncbi:MAG: bifunctional phosphoglucose/phosphomannose isomerase [Armatimonadetes bacterium]|nr:bifunctional phosphoglucose/phosphomannose isomerase [Armatimonadota bacterium]